MVNTGLKLFSQELAMHSGGTLVPQLQRICPSGPKLRCADVLDTHFALTGGTGGVGLMVAEWLTQHQSERLGLLSRSGQVSVGSAVSWAGLCSALSSVRIEQCDVGVSSNACNNVTDSMMHCAGVLADALLVNQTQAGLQRVWAPKATAACACRL